MEIVKLKGADFGIEETKAQEISKQFKPMLDKMVELEKEYNKIIRLPKEKPETAEKAGELRKKLVKVRTGTAEIHKAQKAFYLAGGRFVDAWKNAQLFASQGLEEKLLEIETYQIRIEREKQEKLREDRENMIRPYLTDFTGLNLGAMQEDVWEAYFDKKKRDYEDLKKAEEEAERKRLEEKRIEDLHDFRERLLRPYFDFIPQYADYHFGKLDPEQFQNLLNGAKEQYEEYERKERLNQSRSLELRPLANFVNWDGLELGEISDKEYAKIKKDAEKACIDHAKELEKKEAENKRLKAEAEAKEKKRQEELEKERKAREKLEAELKAKREAEEKAEAERKAKAEAEAKAKAEAEAKAKAEAEALAKAGDVAILKNWIEGAQMDLLPKGNLTDESFNKACEIYNKFMAFKAWAYKEIEKQ